MVPRFHARSGFTSFGYLERPSGRTRRTRFYRCVSGDLVMEGKPQLFVPSLLRRTSTLQLRTAIRTMAPIRRIHDPRTKRQSSADDLNRHFPRFCGFIQPRIQVSSLYQRDLSWQYGVAALPNAAGMAAFRLISQTSRSTTRQSQCRSKKGTRLLRSRLNTSSLPSAQEGSADRAP